MVWFMVLQVVSTLVELVRLGRQSESEKDLEVLLLRQQVAIYERRQKRSTTFISGREIDLGGTGKEAESQDGVHGKAMGKVIRIVKPTTLFGWQQ